MPTSELAGSGAAPEPVPTRKEHFDLLLAAQTKFRDGFVA